ncbi:MAG: hypothetical protein ACXVCY_10540 [Pseudobdellovibrionaceae bacterium]
MKTKVAIMSLLLFQGFHAFAGRISMNQIKCVADNNGGQRINLEVPATSGLEQKAVEYNGHKVNVGFYPGDPWEAQQILTMRLDGYQTRVYDPKESLYMLEARDGVKIQCSTR